MYNERTGRAEVRFCLFTLVELMIVVAIIILLISLSLPALNRAKESGRSLVCKSNFKNSMTASLNYMEESNGWGPPHYVYYAGAPVPERTWAVTLDYCGYLPKSAVTLCPAWAPSHKARTIYQCSGMLLSASWKGGSALVRWTALPRGTGKPSAPSLFWVLGDSIDIDTKEQSSHITSASGNPGRLHLRHMKQANIAFLDGHVENVLSNKAIQYGFKVFYMTEAIEVP